MWRWLFISIPACGILATILHAQTTSNKPRPIKDEALQTSLEKLLQVGTPAGADQALALLQARAATAPKDAEAAVKELKNLRATLISQASHPDNLLNLISLLKNAKRIRNAAGALNDIGYLWAMEVIALHRAGKPAQAKAVFENAIDQDLGKQFCGELMTVWPLVFKNAEEPDSYAEVLRTITLTCWDNNLIETALKKRIVLLNTMKNPVEALADAKRLFIISSMPHTAAAILAFDQQLALADPSKTATFRKEQTDGTASPPNPSDAKKCTVLLAIKLDATPDKTALQARGDGTPTDALLHPATVHLLCGQPEEALAIAKTVAAQTTDPIDAANASAMIAKCMKAQDGTVGRANACLATKPAVLSPVPKPSNSSASIP